ncbi:CLUMA_CG015174, isoform A [Clunio marinus]|uniref:CLUMA_CG015174, isoform A n=1 Tax=Clunio marinus TaxID=568069 RepID=A0A1J1INM6_9DIPT|nr:CLUMA_CG015174, isoform A [Clunio marinus]
MLPEDIELYCPYQNYYPRCMQELKMLDLSQRIRSKHNWHKKVLKNEIVSKWRKEAEEHGYDVDAIDYVIEEVKYYATLKDGSIEPGPVDGSWQADNLIDDAFSYEFKKLVSETLENIPDEEIDYHPGSDNQVIDLVHPSLYCYVEDMSLLINRKTINPTVLSSIENPKMKDRNWKYVPTYRPEAKYRWMPAEISFKDDTTISFDSYINNLHPFTHNKLYDFIGEILRRFIPMFNRSLTDVANPRGLRIDLKGWSWYHPEDTSNSDYKSYREYIKNRPILPVPVPKFEIPIPPEKFIDLNGEKLQIIVKLSYIKLTPEKPKYPGGTWHVEGIDEERIVATGIYYYDVDNITESKLSFRISVGAPNYSQDDHRGVEVIYGFKNREPLNQVIGHLITKQDRCIVFPNVYQHVVTPFELIDETKPGYRKILVFFLVDPYTKIVSTHNVLPQQPGWDDVDAWAPKNKRRTFTRRRAEENREKLMFERKYRRDEYQEYYYEREFSLCEH